MSTPTIHYFRLLSEVVGISPGSVITAIWDGTRFLVSRDQWGTSYFSVEDISAVAVEVGEDERATYIESINSLDISSVQGAIDSEVKSLLSGDALSVSDDRTLALPASKFGQFRNGALLLSRRADQFKAIIENNTRVIAQNAAALKVKAELEASRMKAQMAAIQEQMKVLGHALHMANLYLGSGEIVVPIRDGDRADASEPIQIRQRLLYMDEEIALLHESGIDYTNLAAFDDYVMRPDVLDLVLPEKKGIVVLRPCRELPRYNGVDPITQAVLNAENSKTYWLIRNGDALWRFWADFDAPSKIFPDRIQEVSDNRPGSAEYYKQMESEERHDRLVYMKAGLLVQGIIDRTLIFAPFLGSKPSLTDPDSWNGQVVFVYDSEAALGEGRPSFRDWQKSVNKYLAPGQRIVTTGGIPYDEDDPLVSPKGACGYNYNNLWTLEADSRGFFFKFPRTDWRAEGTGRRGTCLVRESGSYFLNFDAAKEEDFEFYMRSREMRSAFKEMVPLLRRCKELKEVERADEAPFRALLRQSLINAGAGESDVDNALDGLILWWKSKNKNFRPLVGDDRSNALAFTEIIARFSKRVSDLPTLSDLSITDHDGLALVVAKDEKTAIAYFQADPLFPTFFNQKTYRRTRGEWKETDVKSWLHIPHHMLAHPGKIFIDIELSAPRPIKGDGFVAKPILDQLAESPLRGNPLIDYHSKHLTPHAVVAVFEYKKMRLFLVATDASNDPVFKEFEFLKGKFHVRYKQYGGFGKIVEVWQRDALKAGDRLSDPYRSFYIVAAVTPEQQHEYVVATRRKEAWQKLRNARHSYIILAITKLEKHYTDRWRDEQFDSYLKQGGDVSLFEDHLRTVKMPDFSITPLDEVLRELLFHARWSLKRVSLSSFPELLEAAKESHSLRKQDFHNRSSVPDKLVIPDGFTLPHYASKK